MNVSSASSSIARPFAQSASVPWPVNIETFLMASYSTRSSIKPLDLSYASQTAGKDAAANTQRSTSQSKSPRGDRKVQPIDSISNSSKYTQTAAPSQAEFRGCGACIRWLANIFRRKDKRQNDSAQQAATYMTVQQQRANTPAALIGNERASITIGQTQYNIEEKKWIQQQNWLEEKQNNDAEAMSQYTTSPAAAVQPVRVAYETASDDTVRDSLTPSVAWSSGASVQCSSALIGLPQSTGQPKATAATHSYSSSAASHSTFQSQFSAKPQLQLAIPLFSHLRNNSF